MNNIINHFGIKNIFSNWIIILLVTVLYAITGYMGLFFAAPPGYATAIWIPSGIALGVVLVWGLRILPGVFLGSLLTNFYISTQHGITFPTLHPLTIGIIVGIGATLQAMAGWYLIKKWVGLDNLLNHPNDILLFALLAGPVSCFFNATWSNTALLLLGVLPLNNYFISWVTWWIGDNIGVLIFTPLFLILFAKPERIWRQRIMPIFLLLSISFIVVVLAYLVIYFSQLKHAKSNFKQTVNTALFQIEHQIDHEMIRGSINKLNMKKIIDDKLNNKNKYYLFKVEDVTDSKIIYSYINKQFNPPPSKYNFIFQEMVNIDSQKWQITAIPSIAYINSEFSWQLWFVLISGLLFCVLVNIILFIIQGQKYLAQLEVKQKKSALRASEDKNASILRSAGEGIFGLDAKGCVTFINPAAIKMLGFSEDEMIGKNIHKIIHHSYVDKSVYPENACPIQTTYKYGKIHHIAQDVFWKKDGKYFWVEYTSAPLREGRNLGGAVVVFNDISERRRFEFELQKMAHHDALTALPNRISFLKQLVKMVEEAKQKNITPAVCFIDLDNFKQINDTLGHSAGDETLKFAANILRSVLDQKCYLARLGGDEFGIIISDIGSKNKVSIILDRLIEKISQPFRVNNTEIHLSISIGVAIHTLRHQRAEELIMDADIAMYHVKESGKGFYTFFDDKIKKQVKRKHLLDLNIRKAIERSELSLNYQFQVDAQKMIFGVEALLRWHNDKLGGSVSPSEFIPIAEANSLIHRIGEWAIKQACLDYKKIIASCKNKNMFLCVNISVIQFDNSRFFETLKRILNETQIKGENILLEITETSLMRNPKSALEMMTQIKTLGVRFALDDFGVDYSSMQYLKNFPISLIKIDQEFIHDMPMNMSNAKIVNAIIQLSQGLNINTLAEGVETKEQCELLLSMGCEYMQGYYFAHPMPLSDLLQHSLLTNPHRSKK